MPKISKSLFRTDLFTRLSLIILANTAVVLCGVWLLFFFPEHGPNEEDLKERESSMISAGREICMAAHEVDISSGDFMRDSTQSVLRRRFLETQKTLEGVQRQVVYRISESDSGSEVSIIEYWVDDLRAGMRVDSELRQADLEFVKSMRFAYPGRALRTHSDYNNVTWYTAWWDESAPVELRKTEYVYQITLTDQPPILGEWRFIYALIAFFLASVLISLLLVHLLRKKLADPLKSISGALAELTDEDVETEDTVNPYKMAEGDVGGDVETILGRVNQMSDVLSRRGEKLTNMGQQLRETNEELSDSKVFLETVLEASPQAIIATDLQNDILIFNYKGRELFGYTGTEDAPTDLSDLFAPGLIDKTPQEFDLSGNMSFERLCVRADGSQFPALVSISPLNYSGGVTSGYLYMIGDISESEGYKEMMIRLDHLSIRGEMAGDIAHDINNFLAVIQGNAELLTNFIDNGDREKVDKRLELIKKTVEKIAGFTEGLMKFESRELTFLPEDINQLIHNLIVFLEPQKRLIHVKIKLEMDNLLRPIIIDQGLIQQTLVNLIYNAADALAEHDGAREIIIRTESLAEEKVRVSVSDSGPGVPRDRLPSLFNDRFTTKRKGHGIGLLTSAKIIQAHHGEIVYLETEGGGATFAFTLPCSQPDTSTIDTQRLSVDTAKFACSAPPPQNQP